MPHPRACERIYERNTSRARKEGDYEFATTRFQRASGHRLERGYGVALHFADMIRGRKRDETISTGTLAQEFRKHADAWWRETRILSSIDGKIFNQHYQRIIGMGRAALPFIFNALRDRGGQWYWALECITGDNPAKKAKSLSEARDAWIKYAIQHKYLSK